MPMFLIHSVGAFLKGAAVIVVLMALPVQADTYLLGAGDAVRLEHSGASDAVEMTIDADGQVRIPSLGGVSVAGLSLNAAEVEIERRMVESGVFVDPVAGLQVLGYAPVVVAGDVLNPGRFSFQPGMTVAAAVALSGGGQAQGLTRGEVARARADIEAGLRTANLDIALAVARLARFEAVLAGADAPMHLNASLSGRIPVPENVDLAGILRIEAELLASDRQRAVQLLSSWALEIETIEAQAQNFDARIAVQHEIVASALANLEASQELTDRGLQTSAGLAVAEQREADARRRVLELEGVKIVAARAIAAAQRERTRFLAGQERDALGGVRETKDLLETSTYRYHRYETQLATLSGVFGGTALNTDTVRMTFELQSGRADRPKGVEITPDTLILPGEILVVTIAPLIDDLEG